AGEVGVGVRGEHGGGSGTPVALRHGEGREGQWGVEDLAHGPADHSTAKDIQDGDQIEPALAGEHTGGIGRPDLVKLLHGKIAHTIRRDRSAVAAVGRGDAILGALPSEDALLSHEPSNAVTPSRTTKRMSE